jgi:hypothetical protein
MSEAIRAVLRDCFNEMDMHRVTVTIEREDCSICSSALVRVAVKVSCCVESPVAAAAAECASYRESFTGGG